LAISTAKSELSVKLPQLPPTFFQTCQDAEAGSALKSSILTPDLIEKDQVRMAHWLS
jgi:hypothetical protein